MLSNSPSLTCGTVPHQTNQVINSINPLQMKVKYVGGKGLVVHITFRTKQAIIHLLRGVIAATGKRDA